MNKAIFNWSGGKDSSLSLYYLKKDPQWQIKYLMTLVNESYQRISMHGVRVELLEQQAESIGIPLYKLLVPEQMTMDVYNRLMKETLEQFKKEDIHWAVFGDIFLEDLKKYREEQLAKVEIKGHFPIWKKPTFQLAEDFIRLGFQAIIVCVDGRYLEKSFVGRLLDKDFLKDLPQGVDPCGENGEYHSFVFDGPLFRQPVNFKKGDIVYKRSKPVACSPKESSSLNGFPSVMTQSIDTGCWYCDLLPVDTCV